MTILTLIFGLILLSALAPALYRKAGRATGWILALGPLSGFIWFCSLLPEVISGQAIYFRLEWFPALGIGLDFYIDGLSLLMGMLITGIGTLIVLYAEGYLGTHALKGRFFGYLLLFMSAMLGIVTADNLIVLFVFWELTSISSYLLIGFYHESADSRKKALQALLVTGLGGVALLGGFILLGIAGDSWRISELLDRSFSAADSPLYPLMLTLILIGAFTKSAQFPFHFWLPNAMAAPAPVSSFLHSATMVKAGVFLLARIHPIMDASIAWTLALTIAGLITMLVGAVNGLLQNDIKKILAYTTLSVLGVLVMLLGLGTDMAIKSAILFLLGHALYKATLFMCAGAVDHEAHERDVRLLGGLRKAMPFTAFAALLAALSKSGFPPFFGFLGKEYAYKAGHYLDEYSFIILATAVATNVMLMALALKVGVHVFWAKPPANAPKLHAHEAPWSMLLGPLILAITGLVLGVFPGSISTEFVRPAVEAVAGHTVEFELALWHGFNTALVLSLLTLAGGLALYLSRRPIWRLRGDGLPAYLTFDYYWQRGFNGFLALAKWQTKVLQSGYLRRYLLTIFCTSVGLIAWKLSMTGGLPTSFDIGDAGILDWAVVLAVLGGLFLIVTTRHRMTALMALGIIGFGVALVFILYGAPDLAITQILVETLTVVLFMIVVYRLPEFRTLSSRPTRIFDGVFAGLMGVGITLLVLKAQTLDFAPSISTQYGEWSYLEAKGRNVVNVILVDFRALDTLGEITVLAIAALGIFTVLRAGKRKGDKPKS